MNAYEYRKKIWQDIHLLRIANLFDKGKDYPIKG